MIDEIKGSVDLEEYVAVAHLYIDGAHRKDVRLPFKVFWNELLDLAAGLTFLKFYLDADEVVIPREFWKFVYEETKPYMN